jgi:hypothetical protein
MNQLISHSEKVRVSLTKLRVNLEECKMDPTQEKIGEVKIITKKINIDNLKILIFVKVLTQIFLLK